MDFLILFVIYVALTTVGILCFLYADNIAAVLPSKVASSFLRLKNVIGQILYNVTPTTVTKAAVWAYEYFFFTRNPLFVLLYLVIVVTGHLIYGVGCLPYVYALRPNINHVFVGMLILTINTIAFLTCCLSDPGVLDHGNISQYQDVFAFDGIMYKPAVSCVTCKEIKPARSKHCTFLNRCVFRFDHYCAWIHNTVGVWNHRWFMLFLLSLTVMTANSIRELLNGLRSMTAVYKLWELRYLDTSGQSWPMDWPTLIQTLFMKHPYVVFVTFTLFFTLPIIGILLCYHVYLMATNQTTNERYKKHAIKLKDRSIKVVPNPYDKGVLTNLFQSFYPESYMNKANQTETSSTKSASSKGMPASKDGAAKMNGRNKKVKRK